MTNKEVLQAFLQRTKAQTPLRNIYGSGKGRTLKVEFIDDQINLINYNTIIAIIKDDMLLLNNKKYSVTTSKIQGRLRYLAKEYPYNIVEGGI